MNTRKEGYRFEHFSSVFLTSLQHWRDYISWCRNALVVYEQIEKIYAQHAENTNLIQHTQTFCDTIKELEKYLSVDLLRHIDAKNGNEPYYLDRVILHLDGALELLPPIAVAGGDAARAAKFVRDLDHVSAELQATFMEYGFCQILEASRGIDEAKQKFEALFEKLDAVERSMVNRDDASLLPIADIQEALANYNGLRQSMTEHNMELMRVQDSKASGRLDSLLERASDHIFIDAQLFLTYAAAQNLLLKPIVQSLHRTPAIQTINAHMIHPGTRSWLLERVQHWLAIGEKRMFILAGSPGTGKTAFASSTCKLYDYNVIAQYFINKDNRQKGVKGLIHSIASDLCRTLPEYLNWLDDNCSKAALGTATSSSWRKCYELLIQNPLQILYGNAGRGTNAPANGNARGYHQTSNNNVSSLLRDPISSGGSTPRSGRQTRQTGVAGLLRDPTAIDKINSRRQLIVIDGHHECTGSEWEDMVCLLTSLAADLPQSMRLMLTVGQTEMQALLPRIEPDAECVVFESRSSINRHINDIEVYLCSSLGAVLSGERERDSPDRARADDSTLQNTIDELLKNSAGRFDYAIELMESFLREMGVGGQFLSSVKKAAMPVERRHPADFGQKVGDFASPFRSYRDKEGRHVGVRVLRQSTHPMDKTRVALIKGRQRRL